MAELSEKIHYGDSRDEVYRAAMNADLPCETHDLEDIKSGDPDDLYLSVGFPNGQRKRRIYVSSEDADVLRLHRFPLWTFIGDYNAVLYRDKDQIEAVVGPAVGGVGPMLRKLMNLPGVEILDASGEPVDLDEIDDSEAVNNRNSVELYNGKYVSLSTPWRLILTESHAPISMEISQNSPELTSLIGGFDAPINAALRPSLKINVQGIERHDVAKKTLDECTASLFFEMDVKFEIALSLDRRRAISRRVRRKISEDGTQLRPQLPRRKYAQEAVTLYSYGRTALNIPLLQYLAYYQAIEFFFPSFYGAEVISKIKNELRDPRFDIEDDNQLQRIVAIASSSGRGAGSEKDQLLATLRGSLDDAHVREYIKSADGMEEFLAQQGQIKGVSTISLSPNAQVLVQVAERVYKIRCRIVHSKADGGPTASDVLLPYSEEANKLNYDLSLIHYLCQRVIACGSRGSLWHA
ncbi:hypothetical protein ACIOD2_10490 [Amycolatopsis sp. NPDC088138]|uniref:hypothetical protein n=1 Tax=Amycolatopsis sp. NPDC088138 TaxID=3363938 RepID=UPI00380ABBB2